MGLYSIYDQKNWNCRTACEVASILPQFIVKIIVKNHSSMCSDSPYSLLIGAELSIMTTSTLKRILTLRRTSKAFPAGVSASNMISYIRALQLSPGGLLSGTLLYGRGMTSLRKIEQALLSGLLTKVTDHHSNTPEVHCGLPEELAHHLPGSIMERLPVGYRMAQGPALCGCFEI